MKSHQVDGFNFLQKNLIAEEPGGCILAHAPGTGKTFLIISFIQSFLTKYPEERPLIVAPKSILPSCDQFVIGRVFSNISRYGL